MLTKKRVDDGATKRTLEQDLEAAQAAVEALEGERASVRKLGRLLLSCAGTKTVRGVRRAGSAAKRSISRLKAGSVGSYARFQGLRKGASEPPAEGS